MPKHFDSEKDIPDLEGKVILVTGGNAGIGEATVRALAGHNASKIFLCCRRRSSGEAVVNTIHQQHPDAKIEILELDLSSFDSVKKCAAAFDQKSNRLDILFLNAGIASTAPAKTKEGYENQFGGKLLLPFQLFCGALTTLLVNHMGHALLTQLLLPKMLQTAHSSKDADVRIVLTSSVGAMRFSPKNGLALEEMQTDGSKLGPMTCYGHSKLANVLFAKKLAQLYPSIMSISYHPGTVHSEIWGKSDGMNPLVS